MEALRQIADAVLYEGYLLWPYRRSAIKNQQSWTFGGVYPAAYSAQRPDDPSVMQTQCLLEADDATAIDVAVRFLHVVRRRPERPSGTEPVDVLEVGGERHVAGEEATEREIAARGLHLNELRTARRVAIRIPAGSARERIAEAAALVRSWQALEGAVEVRADRRDGALFRLTVRISNTTPWEGADRRQALERTFCSTHTTLRAQGGAFVSLTDPPAELRAEAEACENAGTWPVLVGDEGDRSTILSSPIILPDYPRVAPESPGDLFDATEIDQLLVLNILSLTDEEKREMRESDPRAREILERTESLTEEQLMRLHGAIREFGMVRRP